jgi:hypothetical protein
MDTSPSQINPMHSSHSICWLQAKRPDFDSWRSSNFSSTRQDRSAGIGSFFKLGKTVGTRSWQPPSSVTVKVAWSFTSCSLHCFMAWGIICTRTSFSLQVSYFWSIQYLLRIGKWGMSTSRIRPFVAALSQRSTGFAPGSVYGGKSSTGIGFSSEFFGFPL